LNRFQTLPDKENDLLSFSLIDISENHRKRPIERRMIEITLGACPAGFGTVPMVSIMGQRHQLFPYQFECPTESSGSCTCIYIYIYEK
jgi:hypothetical protein